MQKNTWENSKSIQNKNSQQTKNTRELSKPDKRYLWKTDEQHHICWWKTKCFSPKIENKARVSALTTSVHHYTEGTVKNKSHADWNGRKKLSHSWWYDCL